MKQSRVRPRLSRTLAPARWREYRDFLATAQESGYEIVSLEKWILAPHDRLTNHDPERRTLVLRHDVDQHPAAVLPMFEIEEQLGVRSTWYFRWRTAHPVIIRRLRRAGFAVGLHYETLTRLALARGITSAEDAAPLIPEAREELKREMAVFAARFGPFRSAAPHGDSRVSGITNAVLLKEQDCREYGIYFDGNGAVGGRGLAQWLTDRSAPEGHWVDHIDPNDLLVDRGVSPILCLTHPNNWVSGAGLWLDRISAKILPPAVSARPIRTGRDEPPAA